VAAGAGELEELCRLVSEYQPLEVIVGLPRSLTGAEGPAATGIRARAQHLARALAGVAAVRLVDERFTTVTAARMLRAAGQSVRQQRRRIDAAAAAEILDLTLAAERTRGLPIGELVSADAPGGPSGEVDMP